MGTRVPPKVGPKMGPSMGHPNASVLDALELHARCRRYAEGDQLVGDIARM